MRVLAASQFARRACDFACEQPNIVNALLNNFRDAVWGWIRTCTKRESSDVPPTRLVAAEALWIRGTLGDA